MIKTTLITTDFTNQVYIWDTITIHRVQIHPVKMENRLPIEGKGYG